MAKETLGPNPFVFPMPAAVIGAMVKGKPNYMVAAWTSVANMDPPAVMVAINKVRYTAIGIKQDQAFSVNIPFAKLAEKIDYCGLFSGRKVDKSEVFESFYGELANAPMITECPVNLECRVINLVELKTHEVYIGEIKQTYASDEVLTEGKPDIKKVDPLIFSISNRTYWKIGDKVGQAFDIGKNYKGGPPGK